MLKSELIKRISSQNPHLFERDIEKVVDAIFDQIVEALRCGDRVEVRGSGPFQLGSAQPTPDATPVLVLPSRLERELLPFSRREKRCASGLIGKPRSQTDPRL
jgi:integration host factor subunit beta